MRSAELPEPGDIELAERAVPEPGPEEALLRVAACGLCRSDVHTFNYGHPDVEYPLVLGHEVVGHVERVGRAVTDWEQGDRVGVGWHGGHCSTCPQCRRGAFVDCTAAQTPGLSYDGGLGEYMTAPVTALADMPEDPSASRLAPFMCGGTVMYKALRTHTSALTRRVGIHGIGGLGHVGIQIADAMGLETVAISTSMQKQADAERFGADEFIVTDGDDNLLDGKRRVDVLLSTVPDVSLERRVTDVAANGTVVVIGTDGSGQGQLSIPDRSLIGRRRSVAGALSGPPTAVEDCVDFCARNDVRPDIETYTPDEVATAFDRLDRGEVSYRAVVEFE